VHDFDPWRGTLISDAPLRIAPQVIVPLAAAACRPELGKMLWQAE
jgi:hypothetical protein